MSSAYQLTLDGREVPYEEVVRGPSRARPLTASQEDILRFAMLNRHGWIRSSEAGRILHAHRKQGCLQAEYERIVPDRLSCCRYAASDGSEACKRLAKRGLLTWQERGVWVTVT